MISWKVRETVCGLDELAAKRATGVTHLLSILDPEFPDLEQPDTPTLRACLTLRFHDIIEARPGLVAPAPAHIDALLAFGRALPEDPVHLLVHCHMGVSRSTAAMAALLVQANPHADEAAIMARLASIRPQAWPNLLMVQLADQQLDRAGRLVDALGSLYARQVRANPTLAEEMIRYGRRAEVELARSHSRQPLSQPDGPK